jgi:biopolymer transport protein ExbB/TolQ
MTKKLRPSTKTLLALLFLLPAAEVAAQESSGGGFMSAIAEFFEAGGPFIYVNCITLAWGIAIILERIIFIFFKYNVNAEAFMAQVQKLVMANDIERAIKLCNAAPSAALPKVVKAGLTRANRGEMEIRNAVEEATLAIVPVLQKRTPNLASIANMATLLGLLGTITGLITAFRAVGAVSPELKAKVLAQGVAEAMYTTAFGLAIAVVCMFGHLFLTNMTKKIIDEIDQYSVKLENLLISRGKGTASALDRIT